MLPRLRCEILAAMDFIEGQAGAEESLLERVAALKHDLGKYVAWTSANLDDAHWSGPLGDELLAALRSDLLETRKVGERCEPAWEVWRSHRAGLCQASKPELGPELKQVERAVAQLETFGAALADGDRETIAGARATIREAQQAIREQLRALHRRLLRER